MDDILGVQVLDGGHNLPKLRAGLLLLHPPMGHQIVEQFAPTGVLHHQEEGGLVLDHLVQLHNVGVVQLLHDAHFAEQLLQTALVEGCFVDDFDGHLHAGGDVLGQFDLKIFDKLNF